MGGRLAAVCLIALLVLPAGVAQTPNPSAEDLDEGDMGTLTQMLHWSLEHQDLDALHDEAEAIRARTALPEGGDGGGPTITHAAEFDAERLTELKELAGLMARSLPDNTQLMRDALRAALGDCAGRECAPGERAEGLEALEELVEDIDNARDFKAMGGYPQVVTLLASPDPETAAGAAWVLGTAAQNNAEIQEHLCDLGVPGALIALVAAPPATSSPGQADLARAKALYALSAVCRDSERGFWAIVDGNGLHALALALGQESPAVVRKALTLITDLARSASRGQGAGGGATLGVDGARGGRPSLARSLSAAVAHNATSLCGAIASQLAAGCAGADIDTLEKALDAADAFVSSELFGGHLVGVGAADAPPPGGAEATAVCREALAANALEVVDTARRAEDAVGADADGDDGALDLWRQIGEAAGRLRDGLISLHGG